MTFVPDNLDMHYRNVRRIEMRYPAFEVLDEHGSTAGTITYLGMNNVRVYVDNFPREKKYFNCNYPIRDKQQFEADIARTGLVLVGV